MAEIITIIGKKHREMTERQGGEAKKPDYCDVISIGLSDENIMKKLMNEGKMGFVLKFFMYGFRVWVQNTNPAKIDRCAERMAGNLKALGFAESDFEAEEMVKKERAEKMSAIEKKSDEELEALIARLEAEKRRRQAAA